MTDSKVLTGRQGRRLSRFRRSPKLAVPKFLLQLSGTYNFPKIDSELTPGHKPKRNGTDRWACTYIRTLSSVWSVSLSWWSSPRLPCQAVFIPLVQPGTSFRPAQNEKSQLCVYSEIALIKWPRRGRLQLRKIVITICAWGRCNEDGVHTCRANIYRPPLNWRETDQVVLFFTENYGRFNNSKLWCVWSGNNEFPPCPELLNYEDAYKKAYMYNILAIVYFSKESGGRRAFVGLFTLLTLNGTLVLTEWTKQRQCRYRFLHRQNTRTTRTPLWLPWTFTEGFYVGHLFS